MPARVAVITGASSGIGRACARTFAAAGYRLGLTARSGEGLRAAAREAEELGSSALIVEGDVSDPNVVERLALETEERYGPIDVWVNNAMVTVLSPVAEMSADEFRRVTEVNYLGTVYGTTTALARMRARNRGCRAAQVHRSCRPRIDVVKAAQDRSANDVAMRYRRTWHRCLQLDRAMRSIMVVVVHELREQAEQMPLVQHDDVVKTLLA